LKAVVQHRYVELHRSIAGLGDLQLTPSFASTLSHFTDAVERHVSSCEEEG